MKRWFAIVAVALASHVHAKPATICTATVRGVIYWSYLLKPHAVGERCYVLNASFNPVWEGIAQ